MRPSLYASHSSGFTVTEYSPRRPKAAAPQPMMQSLFHHRGTEFAEFGLFFNQKFFTPRSQRLRVIYPNSFSPQGRRVRLRLISSIAPRYQRKNRSSPTGAPALRRRRLRPQLLTPSG